MTIQAQVSVYTQVFVPRDYDVFAGLDVDHHSIAATFTDHQRLMQSLRLPYSAGQLLNYVGKHFPGRYCQLNFQKKQKSATQKEESTFVVCVN